MLLRRTKTGRRRRAAAAVELAALLPFLVYVFVIGVDWARLFYYTVTVEQCAREGALWASDPLTQPETGYTSVPEAALSSSPGLSATVTHQYITVDSRQAVEVTVTYPFTTITNFPGVPASESLVRKVTMRVVPIAPN